MPITTCGGGITVPSYAPALACSDQAYRLAIGSAGMVPPLPCTSRRAPSSDQAPSVGAKRRVIPEPCTATGSSRSAASRQVNGLVADGFHSRPAARVSTCVV